MIARKISIFLAQATIALVLTANGSALACGNGEWKEIDQGLSYKDDCFDISARSQFDYTALRYDPAKAKIELVGGLPDLSIPTAKTIKYQEDQSNLLSFSEVFGQANEAIALFPIGDVIADDYAIPGGFVRKDGIDLADRDNFWTGNSAFFCLNDKSQNVSGLGSAFVMFNAFEHRRPVEMNNRLADRKNCPDAVQVGPRIVEYRSRRGIFENEKTRKNNAQYYAVFAQGGGPDFFVYVLFNREPTNLYYIQKLLLSKNALSSNDAKMRMAVNMMSGEGVSLLTGRLEEERGDRKIDKKIGAPQSIRHPVYLAITAIPTSGPIETVAAP